jgi:hypothetical protein
MDDSLVGLKSQNSRGAKYILENLELLLTRRQFLLFCVVAPNGEELWSKWKLYHDAMVKKLPVSNFAKHMIEACTVLEPFVGSNLDALLAFFDLKRDTDESDWTFRKRAFPQIFFKDELLAIECLLGTIQEEWSDVQLLLAGDVAFLLPREGEDPSHAELVKFVRGFRLDPRGFAPD